jgi:prepilin-type N-terminal cleavage/methylation domain-containing protein
MKRTPDHAPTPRGFTLLELMISVAMVLILILGINQVFRIASDTINAGQALSAADRDNRGVQSVLFNDVHNMVTTGGPCLIIRSRQHFAFRNRADELADVDFQNAPSTPPGNASQITAMGTIDIDGNNQEGEGTVRGEIIPASFVNSRSHRLDELMFFANYLFPRQTATGGRLSSEGGTQEAFLWYGHLQLANNQTPVPAYFNPWEPDGVSNGSLETGGTPAAGAKNDNNKYATQWALGRMPILLMGETVDPTTPPAFSYIGRSGDNLSPLAKNSLVQYPPRAGARPPGTPPQIQRSVCDVAQTSIADYRTLVRDPLKWSSGEGWWETVAGVRFWANPTPLRPLDAEKMARSAPIFVRGCTQFIVEYAGDFLVQAPPPVAPATTPEEGTILGTVVGNGTGDGVTDFVVVRAPLNPANPGGPFTTVRRTRWYGMPRNVDTSDDGPPGPPMIRGGASGINPNTMIDVVPLRDVIMSYAPSTPAKDILVERGMGGRDLNQSFPMRPNYAVPGAVPPDAKYVAAWGPSELARGSKWKPTMLRITIVIDDPSGRMSDGQTYQYVFNLP